MDWREFILLLIIAIGSGLIVEFLLWYFLHRKPKPKKNPKIKKKFPSSPKIRRSFKLPFKKKVLVLKVKSLSKDNKVFKKYDHSLNLKDTVRGHEFEITKEPLSCDVTVKDDNGFSFEASIGSEVDYKLSYLCSQEKYISSDLVVMLLNSSKGESISFYEKLGQEKADEYDESFNQVCREFGVKEQKTFNEFEEESKNFMEGFNKTFSKLKNPQMVTPVPYIRPTPPQTIVYNIYNK